ncbi:effector from type III secretion system family protein, partial [Chlamydia psittaci 08DC60]|jgi:acetyl-CoA C-acetyltransferase
LRS